MKSGKALVVIGIIIIVVVVAAGIWIGLMIAGTRANDPAAPSGYSAVYMASGDIYFGKLHTFPKEYLTDALYLQRSQTQGGQPQIGIAAFDSSFWGPVGEIDLNPGQVLFTAPIRNDSQVAKIIANPSLLNQQPQGSTSTPQTGPSPSSSTQPVTGPSSSK